MKKKEITIGTIRAEDIKVSTGHPSLAFRTGTHKPKNMRKQNTRSARNQKAIRESY